MTNPFPIPRQARQTDILMGDGGTVYGPFSGLKIFDVEDVKVYIRADGEDAFSLASVTVEKVSDLPFDLFTIEFAAGVPSTTEYVVSSERIAERSAGVDNGTRISLDALEKELSKISTTLQELRRDNDRALKAPFSQDPAPIPGPEAERVLGWRDGSLVNLDPAEFVNMAGLATAEEGQIARSALQPGDAEFSIDYNADLAAAPTSSPIVRVTQHNLLSKFQGARNRKVDVEPAHNLWEPSADGKFWEYAETWVDLTKVGGVGDWTSGTNGYDNGTVLQDAFGYASLVGGTVYVPRGKYRTSLSSTVSMPDVKNVPGLIGEGKAASCFIVNATSETFNVLKFESCARAVVEKIGFYKQAATDGGYALVLSRIPWSRILDVSVEGEFGAGGFERGAYLQNCLSSKIDLTARDNVYGLYADYLVDGAMFVSRPNHMEVRGNYGRNKRWGIRIDEPSQLDLMAILEGNGWGVVDAFRGGLYIPNAGTEGGSIDIHNCYFELNAGTADIWAPQVINPGTTFNIYGNYFANLENERSVTNHINIENGVKANYNVWGNKFDSQGSYTPSAAKRAITATAPDLVKLNLNGDDQQFTNVIEWPSGFGAMGLKYAGRVNSDGSAASMPEGWTVSRTGAGSYLIDVPAHLSLSDFACVATTMSGDTVKVERTFNSGGDLLVLVTDAANAAADGAFNWAAIGVR
jgi:hypothetical protein